MLLQSPLFLILTALSTLLFFAAGQALTPGSYFIVNVGNGLRVLTGSSPGVPLAQEGVPITAFPTPDTEILSNHIFTINSAMTTMFNEEAQQFAVVDASDGGSAGSGIILCNTTFPVAPFIPIGNSDWSFVQGSEGTIIQLSGRNLAWSLLSTAFGTQITLQTLNPSDLRQQWFFTAHSLV